MEKNKGGRPKKIIDQETFERLCNIMCTKPEICHALHCDEKTLTGWCKRTYGVGFSEIYKEFVDIGKISLRREQYKKAMAGSDTMLIWLGKNYLNQSDKKEMELYGRDGGAIEIESPGERIARKLASLATREGATDDTE